MGGHYPVVDLEFETSAPLSVVLRAWAPFLPGDVVGSMLPGMVFEVRLRNRTEQTQSGTIALSFAGPHEKEAGGNQCTRESVKAGAFQGLMVTTPLASYALGVAGREQLRLGGELGASGNNWAQIDRVLPAAQAGQSGSSVAVDFALTPRARKVVRFILAWHAPTWNAGGYNWAGAKHTFTHMYAAHYPSALAAAKKLAQDHERLLRRILAWQ